MHRCHYVLMRRHRVHPEWVFSPIKDTYRCGACGRLYQVVRF